MNNRQVHDNGPGLRVLGTTRWYGGGYCGVCGSRGEDLVARAVRWWDPDDGWCLGVLCVTCGEEAAARGPRPTDYAMATDAGADPDAIDTSAADDADAAYADDLDRRR